MNEAKLVTLQCMLDELEAGALEVQLAPAPRPAHEGHCIRVIANLNARWYRDFCAEHLSARLRRNPRPDTIIRRRDTIRALRAMIAGRSTGPIYAARLTDAARSYYRRHRDTINELLACAA